MAGTVNSGRFTSWHMERKAENKFSDGDSTTRPAPGTSSKYIVTDGRPSGTTVRKNAWHDGGPGNRGARSHELASVKHSTFGQQSDTDAPWMKGDRSRNQDGQLRTVRADATIGANKTIKARAPELISQFGADTSVGDLRAAFGGMSVSKISEMTQAQRQAHLAASIKDPAALGAAVGAAS